jgi:hypothetical protein
MLTHVGRNLDVAMTIPVKEAADIAAGNRAPTFLLCVGKQALDCR